MDADVGAEKMEAFVEVKSQITLGQPRKWNQTLFIEQIKPAVGSINGNKTNISINKLKENQAAIKINGPEEIDQPNTYPYMKLSNPSLFIIIIQEIIRIIFKGATVVLPAWWFPYCGYRTRHAPICP